MEDRHIGVCRERAVDIIQSFGFRSVCVLAEREEHKPGSVLLEGVGVLVRGNEQDLERFGWLSDFSRYGVPKKLRALYRHAIFVNGLDDLVAWDLHGDLWGTERVLHLITNEVSALSDAGLRPELLVYF